MKNSLRIKKMVGISTLASLVVVLQLISNYVQFGPVSITLALIPMVIGAIIYGPLTGFGLGAVMGIVILTAPSTATFLSFNVIFTILLCILKTGLAGFISGWIFKGIMRISALKKFKFPVAIIVATLIAPLINTGLFILGTAILFQGLSITNEVGEIIVLVPSTGGFGQAFSAAVGFVVFTNFIIEFAVCVLLSPSIIYLLRVLGNRFDLGFQKTFKNEAIISMDNKYTYNEDNI